MTHERIEVVDVLRGVAVLGILLLNVLGWGLPWAAVANPSAWGGDTGADLAYWYAQAILFDGRFRGLFSMLFGASALLLVTRREAAGGDAADLYYRRTLWLMAIGLAHAYLITVNDILFLYGLLGLTLYPLRRASPRGLIAAGLAILLFLTLLSLREGRDEVVIQARGLAAEEAAAGGATLTPEQRDHVQWWGDLQRKLAPDTAHMRGEIELQRSGYMTLFWHRAGLWPDLVRAFYTHDALDVAEMMLIGMGLAMLGIITGQRSTGYYARLAVAAYGVGVPLATATAVALHRSGFVGVEARLAAGVAQEAARLAGTLGHMALVILVVKRGWLRALTTRLGAAGRMAFSNYLLSSLLCCPFFAGYGLGMFGRLARHELLYVVLAVWVIILAWSKPWLARFRYGPAEWAWRSLTLWAPQPMRLAPRPE